MNSEKLLLPALQFCIVFLLITSPTWAEHVEHKGEDHGEHAHKWDYKSYGPSVWVKGYPKCGGSRQSPINIDQSNLLLGQFAKLTFVNYSMLFKNLSIINNGHSVQVNLGHENLPYIMGGGLAAKYNLVQFHFHWSQKDSEGSETTIDGKQYPLELHLVHTNSELSLEDTYKKPAGLAVLAVLFRKEKRTRMDKYNRLPEAITDAVKDAEVSGSKGYIEEFRAQDLLPKNPYRFYRYQGSLTTPPCAETVIWTVFADTVSVSEEQLANFRKVKNRGNQVFQSNFRPVQGLNGRTVLYSSDSEELPLQQKSESLSIFLIVFVIVVCVLLIALVIVLCLYLKLRSKSFVGNTERDPPFSVAFQAKDDGQDDSNGVAKPVGISYSQD